MQGHSHTHPRTQSLTHYESVVLVQGSVTVNICHTPFSGLDHKPRRNVSTSLPFALVFTSSHHCSTLLSLHSVTANVYAVGGPPQPRSGDQSATDTGERCPVGAIPSQSDRDIGACVGIRRVSTFYKSYFLFSSYCQDDTVAHIILCHFRWYY